MTMASVRTILLMITIFIYREDQTGDCNAFRYLENSGSCDLAKLTFLEDPNVGESPLEVMQ